MTSGAIAVEPQPKRQLAFFERYLSVWLALCMVTEVVFCKIAPSAVQFIRGSRRRYCPGSPRLRSRRSWQRWCASSRFRPTTSLDGSFT
jgi:hypothetical protein